ncbi:MAG: hypothetical protein RIB44_04350 [Lacipirellulaceae bacterium]
MTTKTQTKCGYLSVLLTLAILATLGCSSTKSDGWKFAKSWDVRMAVGLKSDEPEAPQTPSRLVCSWTQAVHHQGGSQPKRGFGGRIVFFKRDSDLPVRVDGQLVVYAFDESDREAHETHPTKRFIFPPEQFVRHESSTKLGPAYSVWLPWDAVGGPKKNITLITRFEPREGSLIVGEPTKNLLPGTLPQTQNTMLAKRASPSEVKLASFEEKSQAASSDSTNQLKTATFQIPKTLGEKLAKASQEQKLTERPNQAKVTSPESSVATTAKQEGVKEPKAPARRSLRSEPLKDSLRATLPAQ